MGKSVLRHPGREAAEALLKEGRLRGNQIAERCGASIQSVKRWARALGIQRVRGTEPIRTKRSAWRKQARRLLRRDVPVPEVARRCGVSTASVYTLRTAMRAAATKEGAQ